MVALNKKHISECLKSILLVYKHEGCAVCERVSYILSSLGYKHKKKLRNNLMSADLKKNSLVIVVGGDGTTLKAASMIKPGSMLFSVNSFPERTEGFLTRATSSDFKMKFLMLVEGKANITTLPRLCAKINSRILPGFALNEISISTAKPYHTMVYSTSGTIGKCSGILVNTPIGSTAWALSAGGKKMSLFSKKIQYVIREPYVGKLHKAKSKTGLVDFFTFIAESNGIIVFDSIDEEYHFKIGDAIKIYKSESKVNFVSF